MSTIHAVVRRIFALGAGTLLAAVFLVIFSNALRRYTLGGSFRWGEELPIYLAIYGTMFGVALAYLQDKHIRFTILTDFLSEPAQNRLFAAMDAITAVLGCLLAWSGVVFVMRGADVVSSGLIAAADLLVDLTGLEWLVWIGRMGSWQAAMSLGGVLLATAAMVRLGNRLTDEEVR